MSIRSRYAEINNTHHEVIENGFEAIFIDTYKTDDENESGVVVAKVYGKRINGTVHIFADYLDNLARGDQMVEASIAEAKLDLANLLKGSEEHSFPLSTKTNRSEMGDALIRDRYEVQKPVVTKKHASMPTRRKTKKQYVIAYYGVKDGVQLECSGGSVVAESKPSCSMPSQKDIEQHDPGVPYLYSRVEERFYPVTSLLDLEVTINEFSRLKDLASRYRDVQKDIEVLKQNLKIIDEGLVFWDSEVVFIQNDMWDECHASLDTILNYVGFGYDENKSDLTINELAIVPFQTNFENPIAKAYYYEVSFYPEGHPLERCFYLKVNRKMDMVSLIVELKTRFLGVKGVEKHHLENIEAIREITADNFEQLSGLDA